MINFNAFLLVYQLYIVIFVHVKQKQLNMETLEQNANYLRTKIKRCLHADKFIQAERYEYELELVEEQIKQTK